MSDLLHFFETARGWVDVFARSARARRAGGAIATDARPRARCARWFYFRDASDANAPRTALVTCAGTYASTPLSR